MPRGETPLTRLYLFAAVCALFAIAYGFLGLEPSPLMGVLVGLGPSVGVAAWLAADAGRAKVGAVHDAGWLFYVSWPLTIPWYAFRTRGRGGWWLAIKLYGMALDPWLRMGRVPAHPRGVTSMEYQSRLRIFGLPLVHVASGQLENGRYRRGVARGWIAVGDVAVGGLFAVGGASMGPICLGGVAIGGLAIGGASLAVVAIGGLAVGAIAAGGAAFGWFAAVGGLAVARGFAVGGAAIAAHANDAATREFWQETLPRLVGTGLRRARWAGLALLVALALGLRSAAEAAPSSRRPAS